MPKTSYFLLLCSAIALGGCEPKTLNECLVAAAEDAKSVAALDILKADCERRHSADRLLARNTDRDDIVRLAPPSSYINGRQASVTRSTIKRTDEGITVFMQVKTFAGDYSKYGAMFDRDQKYRDQSDNLVYLNFSGIREFDCSRRRTRWLSAKMDFFVGPFGGVGPIPPHEPQAVNQELMKTLGDWDFLSGDSEREFNYICEGRLAEDAISRPKEVCGKDFASSCGDYEIPKLPTVPE